MHIFLLEFVVDTLVSKYIILISYLLKDRITNEVSIKSKILSSIQCKTAYDGIGR